MIGREMPRSRQDDTAPPGMEASSALLASAVLVIAVGLLAAALTDPGPLSRAMLLHIATMNVVAPLIAWALPAATPRFAGSRFLLGAMAVQLIILWAMHTPPILGSASLALHLGLQASLLLAAVAFWLAVVAGIEKARWSPLGALAATGKLACLLGALLVFAPRPLYASLGLCSDAPASIADQHLAGLLMLSACPLSYLIAGVVLSAHLVLGRADERSGGHGHRAAR